MKSSEVKALSEQYGVRPTKKMGQNFLVDDRVVQAIVDAAQISAKDTVVEIGPGFGALTGVLIASGATVIAIEKDRKLAQYLSDTVEGHQNFVLHNQDALRFDIAKHIPDQYILVGNLPYNITSPLIEHFLQRGPRPTRAVLMVQKEVADRMLAHPPQMNLLAITMQMLGKLTAVLTSTPQSFWPQPEIDSKVLALECNPIDQKEFAAVHQLAKIGFLHKRKQLLSTLAKAGVAPRKTLEAAFENAGLIFSIRPQELSLADWCKIVVYLAH